MPIASILSRMKAGVFRVNAFKNIFFVDMNGQSIFYIRNVQVISKEIFVKFTEDTYLLLENLKKWKKKKKYFSLTFYFEISQYTWRT